MKKEKAEAEEPPVAKESNIERNVEEKIEKLKKEVDEKFANAKFKFVSVAESKDGKVTMLFAAIAEAIQLHNLMDKTEQKGEFVQAYYLGMLYKRLVLLLDLHKRGEERFHKVSMEIRVRTGKIFDRLDNLLEKIRKQLRNKIQKQAVEAAIVIPMPDPVSFAVENELEFDL